MLRRLLASLIGLTVAIAVVAAVQYVDAELFPAPARLEPGDKPAIAAYVASLPFAARALAQAGWLLASFAGGSVAMRVHARVPYARPALLVALALLVASVVDMASFPHPAWFWIATFVTIPAGAWLAVRLGPRKPVTSGPARGTHVKPM